MKWIRPGVVSLLAVAVTVGFFMGTIEVQVFVPFATGLIVWWFKSRDAEK